MDIYEYWIGQDVDYKSVWQSYEEGIGYIDKFRSMRVHLLRIKLMQFPSDLALFNHEAVYKTIKGYFHDLKLYGLSKSEYNSTGPLFLYSVDRGSGIWNFLGELQPLITLAITLAEGRNLHQGLVNFDKKLQIIQRYFPGANPHDIKRLMRANSQQTLQFALNKLITQGIQGVKVSLKPFEGDFGATEQSLFNFQTLAVDQIVVFRDSVMGDNVQGPKVQADRGGIASGRDTTITGSNIGTHGMAYVGGNDLASLAQELNQFREKLHGQATAPEQDLDVGKIAAAEIAARSGDRRAAMLHLKRVGSWALDFATKIGASLTAEFMKEAMGL